MRATKQIKVI